MVPGAERATLESPAQPGAAGGWVAYVMNHIHRVCPRQNRGLNWGGGRDLFQQQWAGATRQMGDTPGQWSRPGATEPLPTAILQRLPGGDQLQGVCEIQRVWSQTLRHHHEPPENYMGSRRRCCQKDGCKPGPLPGKPQLSLMAGVPPAHPSPAEPALSTWLLTCAVTGKRLPEPWFSPINCCVRRCPWWSTD